jgi:hypothetical protein
VYFAGFAESMNKSIENRIIIPWMGQFQCWGPDLGTLLFQSFSQALENHEFLTAAIERRRALQGHGPA